MAQIATMLAMRSDWRWLLAGLVLSGTAGACLSDVEYLRAGNKGASGGAGGSTQGGSYSGSFGNAGTFHVGGTDEGGKGNTGNTTDAGAGGEPVEMGGTAGATGGGTGGTGGAVSGCGNPRLVEDFEFLDSKYVENTSLGSVELKWVKGPYDSTDTSTGKADATASPPSNSKNLANMSILDVAPNDGDPPGAMRYTVPFNPLAPLPEHVHILYIFAGYGEGSNAVNVTGATMKASVTLKSAPNDNCTITVNLWTTGTDLPAAQAYHHVDGPATVVSVGKWSSVQMDLSKSTPATSINQYGFAIHSSCTKIDTSAGGAGGAPEIPTGPTIIEFDSIITKCP